MKKVVQASTGRAQQAEFVLLVGRRMDSAVLAFSVGKRQLHAAAVHEIV
jgi:hypothetical protein